MISMVLRHYKIIKHSMKNNAVISLQDYNFATRTGFDEKTEE